MKLRSLVLARAYYSAYYKNQRAQGPADPGLFGYINTIYIIYNLLYNYM